ncbi:MAG: hypothetical protein NTX56_12790 [Proteobacteria bacterium]|nr:hypothetical protein [Pseudomonadota bacterium]
MIAKCREIAALITEEEIAAIHTQSHPQPQPAPRRQQIETAKCKRNPLFRLLEASHDAHLAQREAARSQRNRHAVA